jgi:hypothetical protein
MITQEIAQLTLPIGSASRKVVAIAVQGGIMDTCLTAVADNAERA